MGIHTALENAWWIITTIDSWLRSCSNMETRQYLGDTLDECSFYGRDWDRKEEPAKTYRDEWMYMHNMRGESMIEYIYIFKNNRWFVSTSKYIKEERLDKPYDGGILVLF